MANPCDEIYSLAEGEVLCFKGVSYCGPVDIPMRAIEKAKLLDLRNPATEKEEKCFPESDTICGANPWEGYRNFYEIAPGATLDILVPDMDGCPMPNRAFFNWCGDCIVVDYNKAAAVAVVEDGTGPEINPRWVWIGDNGCGDRVSTISVANPGAAPVFLTVQYYC